MIVRLWGTRGSLATPGPETTRFGGNTACVEVRAADGTMLVLDAGTGIRRLGMAWPAELRRVDILLTHLHLDHLQGLGFFAPLQDPGMEVHIWGPPSTTLDLRARLSRYISPPLFPVHLRDLPCRPVLHAISGGRYEIGPFQVQAALVIHPGPTLGYRITDRNGVADSAGTLTYLPDHEPALGSPAFPLAAAWTSGLDLAEGADLLIHDAQYDAAEYAGHVGWGHSAIGHAVDFAAMAGARHLVLFHHDPLHADDDIARLVADAQAQAPAGLRVSAAEEGAVFDLPEIAARKSCDPPVERGSRDG